MGKTVGRFLESLEDAQREAIACALEAAGETPTYVHPWAELEADLERRGMAGIATLLQTIGIGPIGARLPVMQGTSFAFIAPLIAIGKSMGMAGIFGAAILNGIFQMIPAFFLKYVKKYT